MQPISTLAAVAATFLLISGPSPVLWGDDGHRMVGIVAAEILPADMPAFFRTAADQLSYLNPEPDRWRDRTERALDPAMNAAHSPEHYINFERLPDSFLNAPDRLAYLDSLARSGMDVPGLLPYRALELTQRIRVGFRQWRAEADTQTRAFIEARIINDAGILGHYVADGANPHHTTIHYNGWAEGAPNPRGFVGGDNFHRRFESDFVRENVSVDDVRSSIRHNARVFDDIRSAILSYLRTSNDLVETLYALDQAEAFGRDTGSAGHHAFATDRLARAAEMLRDLWWTAWVTSEGAAE